MEVEKKSKRGTYSIPRINHDGVSIHRDDGQTAFVRNVGSRMLEL
jgi:hypothetical protein